MITQYTIKPHLFFLYFLWILFAFPSAAFSQTEPEKHIEMTADTLFDEWMADKPKEVDTFQSKFIHMLTILTVLIIFMILAAWALKKMMKARVFTLNQSGEIKVIETRTLSARTTLYVIEAEGQSFLISETASGTQLLSGLGKRELPLNN